MQNQMNNGMNPMNNPVNNANQMNQAQAQSQLTQLELSNLRHLIGGHGTIANKLDTYAQSCQDPQLKDMLQRDAQQARSSQQKLMGFLQ